MSLFLSMLHRHFLLILTDAKLRKCFQILMVICKKMRTFALYFKRLVSGKHNHKVANYLIFNIGKSACKRFGFWLKRT